MVSAAVAEIRALKEADERERDASIRRYKDRRARAIELYVAILSISAPEAVDQIILEIAAAEERGVT
jgi:hypothetical protein